MILDLEATSPDPNEAEILEIAAQDAKGRSFHRFVSTEEPLDANHEAFRFTGIVFDEYEREKVPLERALKELQNFVGGRWLIGHNLLRYDLPLLNRSLEKYSLPTYKRLS
ncbi:MULTISPECIES: 3'-5' exonuclease [Thermus]|uniref:3'-5' exonuclease n=1 Tax=Thermus brockianus TaxID=56956 RepID=UPI001F367C2F|nr:3'-5' exonuclease [Thermus brockianus]